MYYQQTPISEKPEMQTGIGITEAFGIMESGRKVATAFYHGEGKWTHAIKFWLKPITGVVMTEEEFERLYDGIVQNIETSVKRSDMPRWEQVLEMIKRDQIH